MTEVSSRAYEGVSGLFQRLETELKGIETAILEQGIYARQETRKEKSLHRKKKRNSPLLEGHLPLFSTVVVCFLCSFVVEGVGVLLCP